MGNGSVPSVAVLQAQGMVSVQVPRTVDEALVLMNARARTDHMTVNEIAAAVVGGDLRFD